VVEAYASGDNKVDGEEGDKEGAVVCVCACARSVVKKSM
jgi:hypothetical protein